MACTSPGEEAEARVVQVHLDAVGGIAGDMFVAAMLAAMPSLAGRVMADAAAVLPPHLRPVSSRCLTCGIAASRFGLAGDNDATADGTHEHQHSHEHAHPHVDAAPAAWHDPQHEPDHPDATSFSALCGRISSAALHPGTAHEATAILLRIAEAESEMHGVPVDDVHFHELADWDSLLDVVAAGSIAAALAGATWTVSDLPLGGGLVSTRHGIMPVPAPATTTMLRGFRWRDDRVGGERVTPTGAAILAHLVRDRSGPRVVGTLAGVGMGAGTRDLPGMPNVLRAMVFRKPVGSGDVVAVLSFDVDDMTGEEIGIAAERLRAVPGVLDLTTGARLGKKGRPVTDFRLLTTLACQPVVSERCFLETSTIGLRQEAVSRTLLGRDLERRDGLAGKRSRRPDGQSTLKVESDELASIGSLAERRQRAAQWERPE